MFIYKIDKKTGKKYRVTVPDWDFPQTGYGSNLSNGNGVFNPIFYNSVSGLYYQLSVQGLLGAEYIQITPVKAPLTFPDLAIIQNLTNNTLYGLTVTGTAGAEYLTISSTSNTHNTPVTLYNSSNGYYYRLNIYGTTGNEYLEIDFLV